LTINDFPEEVLLDIFDSYREKFYVSNYARDWSRANGWFKLAHVCQKWRRIVLTSTSRLDLQLYLTVYNYVNAVMMRRLPPLPIVLDCSMGARTTRDHARIVHALKYCDRIREIAFIGSGPGLNKILKATKRSFPALESLKLCHNSRGRGLILPPTFLGGSTPSLRRLDLRDVSLTSLSYFLSSAKGLVDLSLGIDTDLSSLQTASDSLASYLQAMPCLRRLDLEV
jgi:F-box-like